MTDRYTEKGNTRDKRVKKEKDNSLSQPEKIKACLSHNTDNWESPKLIKYYFRNWFDPCPLDHKQDGLKIEWENDNYVNPPYSKLLKWVEKAIKELKKGKCTILLIPARTDTKTFKLLYENKALFNFITGRLKFGGKNSAPFPSMFVTLHPNNKKAEFTLTDKKYLYEIMKQEYEQTTWLELPEDYKIF